MRGSRKAFRIAISVAIVVGSTAVVAGATSRPAAASVTQTWTDQTSVPGQVAPLAISCPTSSDCIAVGAPGRSAGILATTDGGATWATQSIPPGVDYLDGVSCASASDCVAVGGDDDTGGAAAIVTTNGGATWFNVSEPQGFFFLDGISCATSSDCVAVGQADGESTSSPVVVSTDGGLNWEGVSVPATGFGDSSATLSGVSCPSVTLCVAVGPAGTFASTDGGHSWKSESDVGDEFGSVSCGSATTCTAVGEGLFVGNGSTIASTTDGGVTWTQESVPAGITDLSGVSCAAGLSGVSNCIAVGYESSTYPMQGVVISSSDNGASWTEQTYPERIYVLQGVSCSSSLTCIAVGQTSSPNTVDWQTSGPRLPTGAYGNIIATTDGGATWTSEESPGGVNELSSVSCPSTTECVAVGASSVGAPSGAIVVTTDSGLTWTQSTVPSGNMMLSGVSCASDSTCVAVGDSIDSATNTSAGVVLATADGGDTWTEQTLPVGVLSFGAVSCPPSVGTPTCFVVGKVSPTGAEVFVSTDGGDTWSAPDPLGMPNFVNGISCSSTVDCVAVGTAPSWSASPLIAATTNGWSTWSFESAPSGATALNSVSCISNLDCVAVGSGNLGGGVISGDVLATTDGGATWSDQTPEDTYPGFAPQLQSVSCSSTTACVAIGFQGQGEGGPGAEYTATRPFILATTDGTDWSTQSLPTDAYFFQGVACASTSTCEAVGQNQQGGGEVIGTNPDISTTTTVASGVPNTADANQPIEYSATVTPTSGTGTPTGTVTFSTFGASGQTDLCTATLSAGTGSCSAFDAPVGSDAVTATYSGDAADSASSGTTSVAILADPTTTAASVSLDEAVPGFSDTYSAHVSDTSDPGMPTGSVSFTDGSVSLCTATLVFGTGSCNSVAAPLGPGVVTAAYSGDSMSAPSSSTFSIDIGGPAPPTTTSVTASPVDVLSGGSVTYSTQVHASGGPATGTVDFTARGVALCTAYLTSGSGTCTSTTAPTGVDTITASYGGALNFAPSSGTTTLVVFNQPGAYVPLSPARVCDTRPSNPSQLSGAAAQCNGVGNKGETLSAGGTVSFNVAGSFGVPADNVTAVMLNVTEADATGNGYFTLYPSGAPRPTASDLNYTTGRTVPNLVEVAVGNNGAVSLYSAGHADAIVDLEGYVTTTSQGGAGLFDALAAPARICDTRGGNPSHLSGGTTQCNTNTGAGSSDQLVTPTQPLTINVTGNGGVPATGVEAAVLNVTAVAPQGPGYVTAYPTGTGRPTASNVNFAAGKVVANRVTVPVSNSGQVTFYAAASTDLVIDVSGYFTTTGGTGAKFTPEPAPLRICDTRGSNPSGLVAPYTQCNTNLAPGGPSQPIGPGASLDVQATGLGFNPSGSTAAVLNLTAVSPTASGYLTVYPSGAPPTTSDLNPPAGSVLANMVVAELSSSGSFDVYNAVGDTNVVVDVAGWYSSSDSTATSDLNRSLTNAKSDATQNDQSYLASTAMVAVMSTNDPTLTFTTGASTADNVISVITSADGNAIILAAEAQDSGNCWYAVDNFDTETASSPWSLPGAVFDGAGTWYGEVKNTGAPPTCAASTAPGGANSATQAFQSGSFPNF